MYQSQWNSSGSPALTAEEFTAAQSKGGTSCPQSQGNGCGCGQNGGCGCSNTWSNCITNGCAGTCPTNPCPGNNHQMLCTCQCVPAPTPCPSPIQVEEGCCCKQSFRAALQLLCNSQISQLLDFDTAAFVTDTYVAGATVNTTPATTTPADNLNTLSGSFRGFSPCNCDLLEISALVNTPPETSTGVTATQVPLCQLSAVVLQTATAAAQGDQTAEEVTAQNFRCIQCILSQYLAPCNTRCGECSCPCSCNCDDCCCNAGLLNTLAQSNLSRRTTLIAGPLVLQGVTVLGTVGNVLVLSNPTNNRFYFVCVSQIQFLA